MESTLSAVRWAQQHTVADVMGVEGFDEDDLYAALDWLASQQARIERQSTAAVAIAALARRIASSIQVSHCSKNSSSSVLYHYLVAPMR
jgi:hypothetical protein